MVKNLSSSTPASKPVPEKGKLLMGEMKLGDVKSIASLTKSGLTADLAFSVSKFAIDTQLTCIISKNLSI